MIKLKRDEIKSISKKINFFFNDKNISLLKNDVNPAISGMINLFKKLGSLELSLIVYYFYCKVQEIRKIEPERKDDFLFVFENYKSLKNHFEFTQKELKENLDKLVDLGIFIKESMIINGKIKDHFAFVNEEEIKDLFPEEAIDELLNETENS